MHERRNEKGKGTGTGKGGRVRGRTTQSRGHTADGSRLVETTAVGGAGRC